MILKKPRRLPLAHMLTVGLLPSPIRRVVYRLMGYHVGRGVRFGFCCAIVGRDVRIGDYTRFGALTLVRGDSIEIGRYVRIGALSYLDVRRIEIGDDARVNEQVFAGGISTPRSRLKLGKRTIVMQWSFLNPSEPILIGDDSGVGGHCLLFTHGSWLPKLDGYPATFAPITIGNGVWLPWRVFVLPGTDIGDGAVIGPGVVVSGTVPAHSLAVGARARVVDENYPERPSPEARARMRDEMLAEFADHLIAHGANCRRDTTAGVERFLFTINGSSHEISIVAHGALGDVRPVTADSVLVTDIPGAASGGSLAAGFPMEVDLARGIRWGRSHIGEELVAFISRYGHRFDRAD